MLDSHGRTIRDLRLSITDRCNFRCVYCMDPGVRFLPREELLSAAELLRLARICAGLGVTRIRITGGEPTLHPELTSIIHGVAAIPGVEVMMTTNGALVNDRTAREWRRAGLDRLTLSIDAVEPHRFAELTRSNVGPERVIDAALCAARAGLGPVKLNAVIVRGMNEDQVVPLASLAHDLGVEVRFIEYMPLDSAHAWDRARVVSADEIVSTIRHSIPLRATGKDEPSSTSESYEFTDGSPGRIGVIAPVTRPFCGACSRLRITADGKVRPCLFSRTEWDLRRLLRTTGDGRCNDELIARFLVDATYTKQAGHGISTADFKQPERTMSAIGG